MKLSGCIKVSHQLYPHADLSPYIGALLDAFGPDHCVWASDWPFLRMPERVDYGPLLGRFAAAVWPSPSPQQRAPGGRVSGNPGEPGRTMATKVAAILTSLTSAEEQSLTEVARAADPAVSTAHRLMAELAAVQLLERDGGRFRAGLSVRRISARAAGGTSTIEDCAAPVRLAG